MHLLLLSITSKREKKRELLYIFHFKYVCVCGPYFFFFLLLLLLVSKNNIINNNHVFCNVKSQTDVLIWLPVFFLSLFYISLLLFFFAFIFYYLKTLYFSLSFLIVVSLPDLTFFYYSSVIII